MFSRRVATVLLTGVSLLALLPGRAQAQSAIGGVVKDATGAVMAGVTVEASSPALIEQARRAVTDGAGQYNIVDLRPGLYTVTFTMTGFGTVKRDGIELPTNFTATVNADMSAGAAEETVVSGGASAVDLRGTAQQEARSREQLDAVPTGRSLWGTGASVSGSAAIGALSAPDVGGTRGMQQVTMAVHGSSSRDNVVQVDGMTVNGIESDGGVQQYFNDGMFQQVNYQTSALGADVQGSGVRVNQIPKDGGNTFSGSVIWSHTPGEWQSDNFTDELKAGGMKEPNRVVKMFDFNPGFGGPLIRNRLWFFTSWRRWGVDQSVTDSFYNLDPTHRTYVPDFTRSVIDDNVIKSGVVRLTVWLGSKHKISGYGDRIVKFRGHECSAPVAEEACGIRWPKLYLMGQAKYTGMLSSRLLVETGWSQNDESYNTNGWQASVKPTDIGRSDRITTDKWSAVNGPYYYRAPIRHAFIGTAYYVTGSHSFKGGFQLSKGGNRLQRRFLAGQDLYQEYRNGVPVSVVVSSTPQDAAQTIKYDLALYVMDSWKYKRLTLNPGFRYELFNTYINESSAPAGRFVPARFFAKQENMPNWKDMTPRFGLTYDVFGDGKTAVKFHVGKYVIAYSTVGFAEVYDPMVFATDRRTWTDRNGDDIAQDDEIGPVNTPFNISGVSNRNPAADMKRPYQWEYAAGFQRELARGLSVSFNWVRRDFKRQIWTDNILTTHNDYTVVNVPNPLDASDIIPVYNLNRAKLGLVDRIDDNSDTNGRWYNGYDIGVNSRLGGGNIGAGATIGRQLTATCEVDDPNGLRFCDERDLSLPYLTQFKVSGSYPLPFGVSMSGSWQGYPGVPSGSYGLGAGLRVNYIVDRTIVPTLTQSSVTEPLIKPGTKYLKRWNQVDVRFGKRLQIGKVRVQGRFDIFNVLNKAYVLSVTETYGSRLDSPTSILQGRLFAVGATANF